MLCVDPTVPVDTNGILQAANFRDLIYRWRRGWPALLERYVELRGQLQGVMRIARDRVQRPSVGESARRGQGTEGEGTALSMLLL